MKEALAFSVKLLQHPETGHKLVKKRYKPQHSDIFVNEVLHLEKLAKCNFVPKIFKINPEKLTIYMSYCGESIKEGEFDTYRDQIKKCKKILKERWNVYHNDIKPGNICINSDGEVNLIDFGWAANKKLGAGYSAPKTFLSH